MEIIAGLISLVVLIVFFLLCNNVSILKSEIKELREDVRRDNRREHHLSYQFNRMMGDKEAALKHLNYLLIYDLTYLLVSNKERREIYEKFKKANEAKYFELGGMIPDYPFND